MSVFEAELRGVAQSLDLPQPMRSRILLELRADLEDLAAALSAEGVPEAEARRRAVEALVPSPEALGELRRLHRPLYQRLVDRFSERGRHRLERLLIAGFTGVLVWLGWGLARAGDLFDDPSPWLVPVVALGMLALGVGGVRLFVLHVKQDHTHRGLGRGRTALPFLAVAVVVLGLAGSAVDLHGVAASLEANPAMQAAYLLRWLRQDMAMLSLSLLLGAVVGLLWLGSEVRAAVIEQAEMEALGDTEPLKEGRTS